MDYYKELFQKLINQSFTVIVLVLVAYYFVTREREQNDKLLDLYERDREILLETIRRNNEEK
jgi:hypothetical protein